MLLDEVTGVDRAEHELPHEEHVPATGRPDVGDRGRLDRTAQHQVQQRFDRGSIEVVEVDAPDAGALPQRVQPRRKCRLAADGGNQEHEIGIDELAHERGRRRVQELKVVDEEDEGTVPRLLQQHWSHLRHHRHEVAALVTDAGRQQVGKCAEGDRSGALGRGRPGHVAALPVGVRQALVRQPGLADAGRAMDHEAVSSRIAQRGGEQFELLVPPHEGPLQRHDGARVQRPYRVSQLPLASRSASPSR